MTVSIKSPTSTTGSIQLNGSDVLTIESDNSVDIDSGTLHVDATNNRVGVGTTSPSEQLNLVGSSGTSKIRFDGDVSNLQNNFIGITAYDDLVIASDEANSGTASTIQFRVDAAERMRIDSSGKILMGHTSPLSSGKVQTYANSGYAHQMFYDYSSGTGYFVEFLRTTGTFGSVAAVVGTITASTTTTTYATSSDYRLKNNVAPMSGSIDRLKQLKPSTWSWTQDGSHGEGFLAHEAQSVVPEAVTGTKDAMKTEEYEVTPAVKATYDEEGNELTPAVEAVMGTREVPDYQGIDQSKLVPLLTAALQEAITKIENLETRIEALEAN